MAYLTYEEYTDLGGTVTNAAFITLELRARKKLDYHTQDRLTELTTIPDNIKALMALLIDKLSASDTRDRLISGVSNDGYSESYVSGEAAEKAVGQELTALIDEIAGDYAYRGVD